MCKCATAHKSGICTQQRQSQRLSICFWNILWYRIIVTKISSDCSYIHNICKYVYTIHIQEMYTHMFTYHKHWPPVAHLTKRKTRIFSGLHSLLPLGASATCVHQSMPACLSLTHTVLLCSPAHLLSTLCC